MATVPDDRTPDDAVPDDAVPDDAVPDDVAEYLEQARQELRRQAGEQDRELPAQWRPRLWLCHADGVSVQVAVSELLSEAGPPD